MKIWICLFGSKTQNISMYNRARAAMLIYIDASQRTSGPQAVQRLAEPHCLNFKNFQPVNAGTGCNCNAGVNSYFLQLTTRSWRLRRWQFSAVRHCNAIWCIWEAAQLHCWLLFNIPLSDTASTPHKLNTKSFANFIHRPILFSTRKKQAVKKLYDFPSKCMIFALNRKCLWHVVQISAMKHILMIIHIHVHVMTKKPSW